MPTNNEEAGKRALIELQAELVERVQGLNSLFVTAGYGTFFGIWAIAKDDISAFARLWSVLFLLLSATIFVGWHVVGLIATNRAVWNQIEETEPTKRAAKIRRGVANGTLKLARHWWWVLALIVTTALVAIGILCVGLVSGLFCHVA